MVFTLVFVVYVARILGVTGFGKYSLLRGYLDLFIGLSATGLGIVFTREVAKSPKKLDQYFNASLLLITLLTLGASALFIILVYSFPYSPDTRVSCLVCTLALFPSTTAAIFESVFIAHEKAEFVTYGTLTENLIRTGLSLVALFCGFDLVALFIILLATRVMMLGIYIWFMQKYITKLVVVLDKEIFKALLGKWKIFAVENWVSNLFLNLDMIVLSLFHGEVAVGIYSAASRIPNFLSVISASYTSAIFPHMTRLYQESKSAFQRLCYTSVRFMLIFILPCAIFTTFLGDQIVTLLFTQRYAESVPILRVLIWVAVLRFLAPFLSHVLFARGQQGLSLRVVGIGFSIYAVLLGCLTPINGGLGTAWALLLSWIVALTFYFWFILREMESAIVLRMLMKLSLATMLTSATLFILSDFPLIAKLVITAALYVGVLFGTRLLEYGEIANFFFLLGKDSRSLGGTRTTT